MLTEIFTTAVSAVAALFAAIPFSTATWFLLFVLLFFVWLFSKAHRNPASKVDWEDLILDHATDRVSPYKVGYLVGVIVSTWVVVKFADGDKLSWDILGGYLMYLLGGAGWIAMTQSKDNKQSTPAPATKPTPAHVEKTPPAPRVDDVA